MIEIDNNPDGVERCFQLIENIKKPHRILIRDFFKLASLLKKTADEERKKIPFQINVISSAARGRLKETAHSKILYDLLQNELVRKTFIKYFFKDFDIDVSVPMIVPAPDTDRIDAAIRSESLDESQFFIIIENKVNDAPEQQGQIYRYFHIAKDQYGYNEDRIFVLYLNSTNRDEPTDFSMTEKGEGKKTVRDKLQNRLVCRSYKYDVKEWLEQELNAESELLKKEDLLQSALQQYLNYLELYFETSKIYNAMNTKLEELIENELHLNEKNNPLDKLNEVNSKIGELSELQGVMESVKNKYETEIFSYWKQKYEEIYEKVVSISFEGQTLGFLFKYKENEMECCITKEAFIFLGVRFKDNQMSINKNKELFEEAKTFFSNLIPENKSTGVEDDHNWPVWEDTSYQNGFQKLCSITDAIINGCKNLDYVKF